MVYIGIDGGKHIGIAIYNDETSLLETKLLDFWDCIKELEGYADTGIHVVIEIEAPQNNKPVFIPKLAGLSKAATLKIAQDVGRVKRESELISEFAKRKGFIVNERTPNKNSMTKASNDFVQNLIKSKNVNFPNSRTNEHTRDAIMLIAYTF